MKVPNEWPDEKSAHTCFDCPRCEIRMTRFGRECYCKEWARKTEANKKSCSLAEANGYFDLHDLKDKMPTQLPCVDFPPWKVQDNSTGCQIRSANNCGIVASIQTPRCCWSCEGKHAQECLLDISSQVVKQVNETALHCFVRSVKEGENQRKLDAEAQDRMFREACDCLRSVHSQFRTLEIYSSGGDYPGREEERKCAWERLRKVAEYAEALALWYYWAIEFHDTARGEYYRKQMEEHMDVVDEISNRLEYHLKK